MARPDKVAAVEDVKRNLNDSAATLLTHYRGLSVTELQQLRRQLREADASYRVIKNTLSRRAMAEAGVEGLEELLEGPTALVFCRQDPVGPAKALRAFSRDHPELLVRGAYLDGEVLDDAATMRLADLSSRDELLTELAGLMHGALANTARLLREPIEQQARLVQALVDAGGAGAPETDAAGGDAAEAATDETAAGEAEQPNEAEPAEAAADETADAATATADAGTAEAGDAEPEAGGDAAGDEDQA